MVVVLLLGEQQVVYASSLVVRAQTLYLGKRGIVKEYNRYKIYLPKMYNDLWEELRDKNVKIKVYIVVDSEDSA